MSKFIKVQEGNFKVKVADGEEITLDTGTTGTTRVTGDLVVEGDTFSVETQDLNVRDNIITLNDGDTGNSGITADQSGIRIDRGANDAQYPDVRFVFDENITWNDPVTDTLKNGAFTFEDISGNLIGIQVNSIDTNGGDLNLINKSTGVITVSGTNNYEDQITDDDDVPNKKYVDDAIVSGIQNITIKKIEQGDSKVELSDDSIDGGTSNFNITVDGNDVATFGPTSTEIEDLVFDGTEISSATSNSDLILTATGSGNILINSGLHLEEISAPASTAGGATLYGNDPNFGASGVYFVNDENTGDELISTNRSIVYAMLF